LAAETDSIVSRARGGAEESEMGEILGLGCTHYPGLTVPDERLPAGFYRLLTAPGVPAHYKDRANWPDEAPITALGASVL
jgi:hypothetical protein